MEMVARMIRAKAKANAIRTIQDFIAEFPELRQELRYRDKISLPIPESALLNARGKVWRRVLAYYLGNGNIPASFDEIADATGCKKSSISDLPYRSKREYFRKSLIGGVKHFQIDPESLGNR